jgi:hypothetical protein
MIATLSRILRAGNNPLGFHELWRASRVSDEATLHTGFKFYNVNEALSRPWSDIRRVGERRELDRVLDLNRRHRFVGGGDRERDVDRRNTLRVL